MEIFDTSKLYYGFPVIVIGYKDEKFGYNITTNTSSYTLGDMIVIGTFFQNNIVKQISKYKEFSVHVAHLDNMLVAEQAGFLTHVDKMNLLNLDYKVSDIIDAPILDNFPLVIECKVEKIVEFDGYVNFFARIVRRQISGELLNSKGNMDSAKLNPIIYMGDGKQRVYRYICDSSTKLGQFIKDSKRNKVNE